VVPGPLSDATPSAVTGFVVAGGKSLRMGRDKALLPWDESTLLDHAIARLRSVTQDVRVLCGPARRYEDRGVPLVLDSAGSEPSALAGVHSGLLSLERGCGLFLAVDLPRVPVRLLRLLIGAAADYDAAVPFSRRGPEPLCAVYARSCLEPIARCIKRGELKMTAFWPEVRVREIRADDLRAFGDPDTLFANVNEPEDYERARK